MTIRILTALTVLCWAIGCEQTAAPPTVARQVDTEDRVPVLAVNAKQLMASLKDSVGLGFQEATGKDGSSKWASKSDTIFITLETDRDGNTTQLSLAYFLASEPEVVSKITRVNNDIIEAVFHDREHIVKASNWMILSLKMLEAELSAIAANGAQKVPVTQISAVINGTRMSSKHGATPMFVVNFENALRSL